MQSTDILVDGVLKVEAAAKMLGVSRSLLYQLMDKGELRYLKFGRARRIPRQALAELAAASLKGGWAAGDGGSR